MDFRIIFHDTAYADMDEVGEYLSQFCPSTSENFFKKVRKQTLQLEEMPYMYPVYEKDSYFRRMVLGDYLLFYSVNEARRLVIVHRIFRHSRDVSQLIEANCED